MKIGNVKNSNKEASYTGLHIINRKIAKSFAKMDDIGEAASISCDFIGKAVVVPAVILVSSDEPKEKKEFSAFKNPVAAIIQLALEVPVLIFGSKLAEKYANKGFFDKAGSDISYNEKAYRDAFIKTVEKCTQSENPDDKLKEFSKIFKSKGYTKKTAEQFNDFILNTTNSNKTVLKDSFKKLESAHKNQFHLKNRLCFIAALLLTPVLCAIEDWSYPKIMNAVYKKRNAKNNTAEHRKRHHINIHHFIKEHKHKAKGGAK